MEGIEVSTGYQTKLKPLFNERGEVVLLYLKDDIEYYQNSLREGEEIIDPFYEFRITCRHFPEEDELICRIKNEYESMDKLNNVILEDDKGHEVCLSGLEYYKWATNEEKISIKQYLDSCLNHITEDITNLGILWMSDNHDSLVWFIDSPKWIKVLANNQYCVEVDVTFIQK